MVPNGMKSLVGPNKFMDIEGFRKGPGIFWLGSSSKSQAVNSSLTDPGDSSSAGKVYSLMPLKGCVLLCITEDAFVVKELGLLDVFV